MAYNSYLYFSFFGNELDPKLITESLGIEPTSIKIKRDPVPKQSSWEYRVDAGEDIDLESYLNKLVELLAPKSDVINLVKEKYGLRTRLQFVIYINITPGTSTPYFKHNTKVIDFLSCTQTEVDFDVYKT